MDLLNSLLGGFGGGGGSGGTSGDGGLSKATSGATLGNVTTTFGSDNKQELWIIGGIVGVVLLGLLLIIALKD